MRTSLITVFLAIVLAILGGGAGSGHAQSATEENISGPMADSLRQRAERVQERRKKRVTQAQREAAAARAKAARAKSANQDHFRQWRKGGINE